MEITLEQVERLREKADVSYEEAKAALEETGGSLLDALILLEKRGRIRSGAGKSARCSTQPGGEAGAGDGAGDCSDGGEGDGSRFLGGVLVTDGSRVKDFFRRLFQRSLENSVEIWRHGELMTSIPLLIAVLLLIVAFGITLPLLVIGLIFGCRYRLAGPDFDRSTAGETVNRAARTVGDTVEHMKDEAQRYFYENYHNHHNKK